MSSLKTNHVLWKRIVKDIKMSNKGGKRGQWSARKAQLAVKIYKSKGGKYLSRKSKNNSLVKWTKQRWRTKSGKNSIMGIKATGERYLPESVIKKLTKGQYSHSTKLKRRAMRLNKQYSSQSKPVRKILRRYLV